MRSRVERWGNSLGLRIPKHFADETGLVPGSEIDLEVVDGSLVVRSVVEPTYTLDKLLAEITPDNLHAKFEWGDVAGNEAY